MFTRNFPEITLYKSVKPWEYGLYKNKHLYLRLVLNKCAYVFGTSSRCTPLYMIVLLLVGNRRRFKPGTSLFYYDYRHKTLWLHLRQPNPTKPVLIKVQKMCLRVWQVEPVYWLVHLHLSGSTHVPPFWQPYWHTAKMRKMKVGVVRNIYFHSLITFLGHKWQLIVRTR